MPRALCALAAVLLVGVCASCSSDPQATTDTSSTSTTAPAPGPADPTIPRASLLVDLSGDTSTEPPIDGLSSVAVSPDLAHLVVLQTTADGDLVVRVAPYEPDHRISSAEARDVLRVDHPYVHAGGSVVFDDEGNVDVSLGAVPFADEEAGPQNPDGVVVRIPKRYLDDPKAGVLTPTRDDLLARGLRNPWRMTRDRSTGDLWIGDVGDGTAEEVNRIPAETQPGDGPNFGFPYVEGDTALLVGGVPDDLDPTAPVWSHGRGEGELGNAIIGGYVYRGDALPELQGRYVFSDYGDRKVRSISLDDPEDPTRIEFDPGTALDPITAFAEDGDGELYALFANGAISQLVAAPEGDATPLSVRPVGNVRPAGLPHGDLEATSLTVVPDGSAFVATSRSGLVSRLLIGKRTQPDYCDFDIESLPSTGHIRDPKQLQETVEATHQALQEHGPDFPAYRQPQVALADAPYARAIEMAEADGWDDPALRSMLELAALERGEFADAARAEQTLLNLVGLECS